MLEVMDKVLVGVKRPRRGKDRSKYKPKKKIQKVENDNSDSRPVVDQVFKPGPNAKKELTKVVAVDCEMVEVDRHSEGLARVSIVNFDGVVLMDKFVIPEGRQVTNFRTWVSGVTPEKLRPENGAIPFKRAKAIAHEILKNRIIVGHSLKHDFTCLELGPEDAPKDNIRDLISYRKF